MSRARAAERYIPNGLSFQPLEKLHIFLDNPRSIHSQRFEELKDSIKADPAFLRQRPLLVSDGPIHKMGGFIYGGNHRARAVVECYDEGWRTDEFPVGTVPVSVADIDEKTCLERLYRDNNEWADWNPVQLAASVQWLQQAGSDVNLLGFDPDEVQALLESTQDQAAALANPQARGSQADDDDDEEDDESDGDEEAGPPGVDHIGGADDGPVVIGIRKLELLYTLDLYREVNELLDWGRTRYHAETNADAVLRALEAFSVAHTAEHDAEAV